MDDIAKKNKLDRLKIIIEAYSIGVRSGVITPNLDDENEFRKMMGLKSANSSVVAEWKRTQGVRSPITLQRGVSQSAEPSTTNSQETNQ